MKTFAVAVPTMYVRLSRSVGSQLWFCTTKLRHAKVSSSSWGAAQACKKQSWNRKRDGDNVVEV